MHAQTHILTHSTYLNHQWSWTKLPDSCCAETTQVHSGWGLSRQCGGQVTRQAGLFAASPPLPWAVTPTLAALENKAMMGPHPGSIKSWSQKMRLRSSFCPYLATLSYYYSTKDGASLGQRKPPPSSPCPALRIWAILISKMKSAAVGIKRWGFLVEGEEVKLSVLVVLNL